MENKKNPADETETLRTGFREFTNAMFFRVHVRSYSDQIGINRTGGGHSNSAERSSAWVLSLHLRAGRFLPR